MTPADIEAIRARAEAATQTALGGFQAGMALEDRVGSMVFAFAPGDGRIEGVRDTAKRVRTLWLSARDVPILLAHNGRLRSLLLDAKKALGPAQGTHGEPCEDAGCHIRADAIAVMTRITDALADGAPVADVAPEGVAR